MVQHILVTNQGMTIRSVWYIILTKLSSYGFHAEDGKKYHGSSRGEPYRYLALLSFLLGQFITFLSTTLY